MSREGPFRVVVVGFVGSIHTVRAIQPMVELGWDVHVVASHPHWADSAWRGVTLHVDPEFDPPPLDASVTVERLEVAPDDPEPVIDGLSPRQRVDALARLIERLRPDLIDTMEIQHAGYLMLEASERLPARPPWLVHNWGSDVFYYGGNPRHADRLRAVLSRCDYYGSECHRDLGLARGFGFRGQALPVLPNPGGFDLERAAALRTVDPPSRRRSIALKATEFFVYRPQTALAAIDRCGELLGGYTLALYTATDEAVEGARRLGERHGFEVEVVSTAAAPVPHEEVLAMHGRARASLSLSISDAICTSFLEAMLMGALPIQSNTGCSAAWADEGRGALFVDPSDVEGTAAALRRALTDDSLVDAAAALNRATAADRLDADVLATRAKSAYERLAKVVRGEDREALAPAALAAELHSLSRDHPRLRREEIALRLLDGGEAPAVSALLDGEGTATEWERLAEDLVWVAGRSAEVERGRELRVVEPPPGGDGWYDGELVERDAHIAALRRHVASLQGSLDGFHRRLEAEGAAPAAPVTPPGAARRLVARLPQPLRQALRRARSAVERRR